MPGEDDDLVLEKKDPSVNEEPEAEDAPELPKEPVDKNESIDVPVQTRAEKKRNRFKEFEERTSRAEQTAEAARREAAEARAQLNQRLQHPQAAQQQTNPAAARIAHIDKLTDELHQRYEVASQSKSFTTEMQRQFEQEARNLQTARVAAIVQASGPQVNEEQLIQKAAWRQFTAEHSDIFHNQDQRLQKWAWAQYDLAMAEGLPDTKELAETILDRTRVKFGLKPRKRGSVGVSEAATQRRLSGVSAQSSGGGDEVVSVKMTAMERKMARELYDKLPPEQAYQKWANGPGKRAAQKMMRK